MVADKLKSFFDANKRGLKGTLCVGIVVSREAREKSLPLVFESLLTDGSGQVSLLGKAHVQKILRDYGITRVLAEEGGRTNRGNLGLTKKYVEFLNEGNYTPEELAQIESWWIDRVNDFFSAKPLTFKLDAAKSLRAVVRDLVQMAEKRQSQNCGSTIVGTILQHLVGAKLSLILPVAPSMHGATVADAVSDRDGDFILEDVVIHVTSSPGEAVIRKCGRNIDDGKRPILITTYKRVPVAEGLAESAGFGERVDIFDIEQFIASNLYELGNFGQIGRRDTASKLIAEYNRIVEACETDPSLRIELGSR